MKKFIIKLAAVTGIIVIIAGISALVTEFSLVTLAIVFAAIITENALCGAYLGKNKHSKKYAYRKYNIYRNNNITAIQNCIAATHITERKYNHEVKTSYSVVRHAKRERRSL
mgnify:CR=1 FL=1